MHQKLQMQGNITIAKSWNQLNDWQVSEIAHLYINTPPEKFSAAYLQMIFVVYQKSPEEKSVKFLKKLLKEVPISELEKHTTFLKETIDLHKFPEIPGLIKPADRIGNISVKQFSTIDKYFFIWYKDRSTLNLKRLVATLYRINENYDDLDLEQVAKITDTISVKQMNAIALAYLFTRKYIEEQFPVVFPPPKKEEEEEFKPIFKKKTQPYISFDKVIVGMSMDELQPLGKKQDVNEVRIYEFLNVLTETILYHRAKAKAHEGK